MLASALAGLAVVVRGIRTLRWYVVTLVGDLTPGSLVDER